MIRESRHAPSKEERNWGSWSGISHSCPPPHTCQFCLLQQTCTVHTTRSSPKTANLFLLKEGTHSVFHWYDHLAIIFVPSISLEDSIKCLEALQNSLLLLLSRFSRVRLCVSLTSEFFEWFSIYIFELFYFDFDLFDECMSSYIVAFLYHAFSLSLGLFASKIICCIGQFLFACFSLSSNGWK